MSEEQEMRLHAMRLAVKLAETAEDAAFDVDIKHIATEIYEFIKGETK
jgi:hypothetical protein